MDIKLENVRELGEYDVCVIGGGTAGTFAAVRAARLGLKTAIVERGNSFGGAACAGLVNIWHSLYDTDIKNQVIAGLTHEAEERIIKRGGAFVENTKSCGIRFNPSTLMIVLDELVKESKVKVYFHTAFARIFAEGDELKYALVTNKEGLGIIKAKFFIDASGDGDVMRDLKMPFFQRKTLQPPTSCFIMKGNNIKSLDELIKNHGEEFGLEDDWGWNSRIPGLDGLKMRADNHIFGVDCSKAVDLTFAEFEGRRKADAFNLLIKKYDNPECEIVAFCSQIGVRETVHYETLFCANELDLLTGKRYEDAVLNGTYRVDIHHSEDNGITFKYLDGTYEIQYGKSERKVTGNWMEEMGIKGDGTKYYQLPFKNLVQDKYKNLIAVGRMINADEGAFGALRVMVNLNQLGEAAGVAAYHCLNENKSVSQLDGKAVRKTLKKGGSAL